LAGGYNKAMENFERVVNNAPIDLLTDAFMQYPYAKGEDSQFFLFKSKEKIKEYLQLYFSLAQKIGVLYSYKDKGYVIVTNENDSYPFLLSLKISLKLIECMGLGGFVRYVSVNMQGGNSLEMRKRNRNKPFIHLEMIAVLPKYQHHGIMKEMMEILFEKSRQASSDLILETDCLAKSQMYKHLGFRLVSTRKITKTLTWYDFEWKPKTGQVSERK
jgi:ribosomal protein S18 acetylase RimI-like enzyme